MSDKPVAAVIYAAKSSEDLKGSIPDQFEFCRGHAERLGWEAIAKYSDEAASAYSGNRGAGLVNAKNHAAALAREGRDAVLLVYVSDRLARGDGERAMHLVEHFLEARKNGYRLASVTESLEDMLHAVLLGERGHADSKAKSAWTAAGLKRSAERGRYHGGVAPYGYRFQGKREERLLLPAPAEAVIVCRIYSACADGDGAAKIAAALNADGIKAPRRGSWDRSTVANILDSQVYAGKVRFNGAIFDGKHEAIVSDETWAKVQAIRSARRITSTKGRGLLPKRHLFVHGILRCSGGAAMRTRTWKHGTEIGEAYICSARDRGLLCSCDLKPIARADIDDPFVTYLSDVVFDVDATKSEIEAVIGSRVKDAKTLLEDAERREALSADALERADRDYASGEIPATAYTRQLARIESELEEARASSERLRLHLRQLEAEAAELDPVGETVARLAALRAAVAEELAAPGSLEQLRAAVIATFQTVVIRCEDDSLFLEPVVRPTAVAGWEEWVETAEGPRAKAKPLKRPLPDFTVPSLGTLPR